VVGWSAGWRVHADGRLDLLPLLGRLTSEDDPGRGAALFHATLIDALANWVGACARRVGITTVALGGGCFLNRILSAGLRERLLDGGMDVLEAGEAPPNDGGLSLGQAWIAMQHANASRTDNAQSGAR
jgi:hydrogenase maturation protein HypF